MFKVYKRFCRHEKYKRTDKGVKMGFAASQARFLALTARLNDCEMEAQQISQERLALSNIMELASTKYEDATSNQYYSANVFDNGGLTQRDVALTYDVIIKDELNGGLGMRLVTSSGLVVVPDEAEMQKQIEESMNSDTPLTKADFFIMKEIKNADTLKLNLEEGNMFFAPKTKSSITNDWDYKSPQVLSNVSIEYDKTDDAAANAEYETKVKAAEAKDSLLEMRLDQLNTEHRSIETEMESLQKVIDDNVESSFGTFG